MPSSLTFNIIRYGSRVKLSNPGKGVAPSPTPWCCSYQKGSLRVTLDCGHQLYFTLNTTYVLPMKRTISSESPAYDTEGWLFQTSLYNWTNVMKKMCQHPLFEACQFGGIAVKKPLFRKQNNVKVYKDWTIEQWNKVLRIDESNFEIFGSNRRV